MNNNHRYCVIMAGGSGSRFWPVSTSAKPKQFLDVAETGRTFLQTTYDRFLGIVPQENILIVTAEKYKDLVLSQIPQIQEQNVLLEPYSRNTAPCIAYATYTLLKRDPQALVVVTPSDHLISDDDIFIDVMGKAFDYVREKDVLMTLGVLPTRPDTNYGYIQAAGGKNSWLQNEPMPVKTFTEKPDRELAKVFISTGEFFWNAGIFIWKASAIRDEMEKYLPEVTGLFQGWESALGSRIEADFVARAYTDCPNISIDYGLMEKTDRAWIYPVRFGWADVGSWDSLYVNITIKDKDGNACNAKNKLIEDSSDLLVLTTDNNKLVAIQGLDDYMVIDTDKVLLICPKDDKKFKTFIAETAMPKFEKYR